MHKYLAILILFALPAMAVEPMSSAVLLEKCSSSYESAHASCRAWIHGFVAGAFASRTAKQDTEKKKESFTERATRTRVSRGRDIYGQNVQARYCIPTESTIEDLVTRLNEYADAVKELPDTANQLMLGMLRKHYPCSS